MECSTYNGKPKRKFDTLDLAISHAKHINSLPQTIHKKVAYKCKVCCKYHIGSNGKLLDKDFNIYKL